MPPVPHLDPPLHMYYCSDGQVCPHLPSALVHLYLYMGVVTTCIQYKQIQLKVKFIKLKKKLYQNKTKTKILA